MSLIRSSASSNRSAIFPTIIDPRSSSPKHCAGKTVAALKTSTLDIPASNKSSSSWCKLSSCGTLLVTEVEYLHLTPANMVISCLVQSSDGLRSMTKIHGWRFHVFCNAFHRDQSGHSHPISVRQCFYVTGFESLIQWCVCDNIYASLLCHRKWGVLAACATQSLLCPFAAYKIASRVA